MKSGTAMDPHPESYDSDPMAARRMEALPPKPPVDEDKEEEADSPAPENPDDAPDDETEVLRAATAKLKRS